MTQKENSEFQTALIEYKKKVLKSKRSSQKFLKEVGVLNEKGELSKHYQEVCTQQDRD